MINDLWYKNAVIYCLSVATFMDANGDGVGDFQGLTRRLDYLHGLGITTIWLMPFQPSPYRDDGYDISDCYGVDSRHGTLGDFVEFTHGAEQRGIRVWTERIIRMRKEVPEVGWGDFEVLSTRDPAVLAIRYDWRNNSVLFVHNLDAIPKDVEFSTGLRGTEARVLVNLLTDDHSRARDDGKHHLLLEAYGYRWYRVGGLDYLLKRSEVETPK
jgi:hypothetical protein